MMSANLQSPSDNLLSWLFGGWELGAGSLQKSFQFCWNFYDKCLHRHSSTIVANYFNRRSALPSIPQSPHTTTTTTTTTTTIKSTKTEPFVLLNKQFSLTKQLLRWFVVSSPSRPHRSCGDRAVVAVLQLLWLVQVWIRKDMAKPLSDIY